MYDIQPMPDMLVHSQLVIYNADTKELAPNTRYKGVVNTSILKFTERSDLFAKFSVITGVTSSYKAGVSFKWVPIYERVESKLRHDIFVLLHFEIENITASPIVIDSSQPLKITVSGFAAGVLPVGHTRAAQRVLVSDAGDELVAKTISGLTLLSEWSVIS